MHLVQTLEQLKLQEFNNIMMKESNKCMKVTPLRMLQQSLFGRRYDVPEHGKGGKFNVFLMSKVKENNALDYYKV